MQSFVKYFYQTSATAGSSVANLENEVNNWLTANGSQIAVISSGFNVADHINVPANGGILYFTAYVAYQAATKMP